MIIEMNGQKGINSKEVAEMTGKKHAHLMRDIQGYVEIMNPNPNLDSANFFISSTYFDVQNQERPCYILTKKGCDMVANKMTGEKGITFTATYIEKFHELEEYKHNVETHIDNKGSYNRLDDLNYKFSEKRTIKTFSNCNVLELPKLMEDFVEYLDTIKDTTSNGVKCYATETKKARYISMLKGLERLRVTLDIGLSHHLLEKYIQPLTKEMHKLENKVSGGIKTGQTKKIKKLQEKLENGMISFNIQNLYVND
jgi:Rha family phage regulatory protein